MKRIRTLVKSSLNSWLSTVWMIQLWRNIGEYFQGWTHRRNQISDDSSMESFNVISDLYNFLFEVPLSNPQLLVDGQVWSLIAASLPQGYVLPNPATMDVLKPMSGDSYNTLFSAPTSNPEIIVDGQVWTRISASLPKGYFLLDPITKDVLKSMSGDLYNSLFAIPISNPEIIIDGQIWKQIKVFLPERYILPDPHTTNILKKHLPNPL